MGKRIGRKKPRKSIFRQIIYLLHLWLGLSSGIIVFIVSITGAIYAFEKEIRTLFDTDIYFIHPTPKAHPLSLPTLYKKLSNTLEKEKPIYEITAFKDPKRAWEGFIYVPTQSDALTFFGTIKYYESIFFNPYTGEITGTINHKYAFFTIIKYLHWGLILNTSYGQPIVGVSTLIFLLLLITGIIMWWPKSGKKSVLKKSFTLKFSGKLKRLNYDMHNVLGFYAFLIALILSITGLIWAFDWVQKTVYIIANRSIMPPVSSVFLSDTTCGIPKTDALSIAFQKAQNIQKNWARISLRNPTDKPTAPIRINIYDDMDTYYKAHNLYFDAHNGRLLGENTFNNSNTGEKIIRLNYDVHTGAVFGLTGKIIAFLVSLICASLPITGFFIWKK